VKWRVRVQWMCCQASGEVGMCAFVVCLEGIRSGMEKVFTYVN
jgi:hypothetical protein